MRVRALDAVGDWTFGKGQNDYKVNAKAVGQNIQTRLMSFLGDCFFDTSAGIDWLNFMSGSKDQTALNLAISAVILNTDGVASPLQISSNLNDATRSIAISWSVKTIYVNQNNQNIVVSNSTSYILDESGNIIETEDGQGLILE